MTIIGTYHLPIKHDDRPLPADILEIYGRLAGKDERILYSHKWGCPSGHFQEMVDALEKAGLFNANADVM